MDLGTIIGVGVVTIAIFVTAILDGVSIGHLMLPAPLMLIFVGTFGAAAGGLLFSEYGTALKGLQRAFTAKPPDGSDLVDVIVKMADRARREGLLALEDMAKEIEDPLLKEGIQMTVDGTDAAEIEELLLMRIDVEEGPGQDRRLVLRGHGWLRPDHRCRRRRPRSDPRPRQPRRRRRARRDDRLRVRRDHVGRVRRQRLVAAAGGQAQAPLRSSRSRTWR